MDGEGRDKDEAAERSSTVQESCLAPGNPDQDVIVEALKSICNIVLHNETGQVSLRAQQLQLWNCGGFLYLNFD